MGIGKFPKSYIPSYMPFLLSSYSLKLYPVMLYFTYYTHIKVGTPLYSEKREERAVHETVEHGNHGERERAETHHVC